MSRMNILIAQKRFALTLVSYSQVAYCSQACQRDNWRAHKHICKALVNGLDEADDAFPSEEEYVGFSLDDAGDDFPPDEKYVGDT